MHRAIGERLGDPDAKRLRLFDCHIWDGLLAAFRGEPGAAKAQAEAARELVANDANPRRLEPYYWLLGVAALRLGDVDQAAALLRRADVGNGVLVRYYLTMAEEATGNADEVRELNLEVSKWNFNSIGFALVRPAAAERAAALTPKESSHAGS